jgi:hypothetical protein
MQLSFAGLRAYYVCHLWKSEEEGEARWIDRGMEEDIRNDECCTCKKNHNNNNKNIMNIKYKNYIDVIKNNTKKRVDTNKTLINNYH